VELRRQVQRYEWARPKKPAGLVVV
jgi:hypothetical protein